MEVGVGKGEVSIHAPAWGATCGRGGRGRGSRFQFTLPRGERPPSSPTAATSTPFQFTLPRGERRGDQATLDGLAPVSIHAPAWGATPRTQAEAVAVIVSIHAPAWGATLPRHHYKTLIYVSIHAPAWGATSVTKGLGPAYAFQFTLPRGERLVDGAGGGEVASFNSRSRVGSDSGLEDGGNDGAFQFTLPRGERPGKLAWASLPGAFQFTLPRGERPSGQWWARTAVGFQFTLPRGERLGVADADAAGAAVSIHAPAWGATWPVPSIPSTPGFQFTLPRGERPDTHAKIALILRVSIHAPAWGATCDARMAHHELCVSIHAPAWGATDYFTSALPWPQFQFTLPRGERLKLTCSLAVTFTFQFTLPRGERRLQDDLVVVGRCFNSRSRVGSDTRYRRRRNRIARFNSRSRVGSD